MNVHETTDIRELTDAEIEHVNGGLIFEIAALSIFTLGSIGTVGCMLGYVADWLFGD